MEEAARAEEVRRAAGEVSERERELERHRLREVEICCFKASYVD